MKTPKKILLSILLIVAIIALTLTLMIVAPGGRIVGYGVQFIFVIIALIVLLFVWLISQDHPSVRNPAVAAFLTCIIAVLPLAMMNNNIGTYAHIFSIASLSVSALITFGAAVNCWRVKQASE